MVDARGAMVFIDSEDKLYNYAWLSTTWIK